LCATIPHAFVIRRKHSSKDMLILPHVNGDCMPLFLDEVAARHPQDRIVMALDGADKSRERE